MVLLDTASIVRDIVRVVAVALAVGAALLLRRKTERRAAPSADPVQYVVSVSDTLLPIAWNDWAGLTAPERTFVLIWTLDAEVNNGGFHQFYWNFSGDHALDTPAALREIGALETAVLVEQANAVFPRSAPPADKTARERVLLDDLGDAAFDAFEPLDQRYYAGPDDVWTLLYDYTRRNAAAIRGA